MKRLLFRNDGSVTIFCALIMMVLTVFLMVLLDYARIFLFQRTSESALKLSAQSVIAAYDRELYQQYGLFARGGSAADKLFREAMELNLSNSYSIFSFDQGSDFVQPKLEEFEIFEGDYLGLHPIFERQVLEEMKYRAPIDFTIELLEQWLSITNAVREANNIVDVINEIESLYEDREHKLEKIMAHQEKIGGIVHASGLQSSVNSSIPSILNGYSQYISWLEYEEKLNGQIAELYDRLAELEKKEAELASSGEQQGEGSDDEEKPSHKLRKQIDNLERKRDKYSSQISSYLSKVANVLSTMNTDLDKLLQQNRDLAEQNDNLLREARTLDQSIQNKYKLYLKQDQELRESSNELENELHKLNFDDTMIRGEQYFVQYQEAIQSQHSALEEIINGGKRLAEEVSSLVNQPHLTNSSRLNDAKQTLAELQDKLENYNFNYRAPATLLMRWQQELDKQREVKAKAAQYEQQFQEASAGYEDILEQLMAIEDTQEVSKDYEAVKQLFQLNFKRNQHQGEAIDPNGTELKGSGKKQASSALNMLNNLLETLSRAIESFRDTVYVNEYALSKFSSFPMGNIPTDSKELASLLNLSEQEVEYILFGVHEPLANVALASGTIFVVRFAIRTIEGFILNRSLTHPLLILGAAVVHGMKEAITDMKQLINEGNTDLSRYAPLKISYPQYLRLLLLLSPTNYSAKLSRMIALIEHHLDISLLKVPTSITVQADLSMHLWSLLGLTELTGIHSLLDSEVSGNVYRRQELITAAY